MIARDWVGSVVHAPHVFPDSVVLAIRQACGWEGIENGCAEVSTALAALSVLVGVIFAIFQMRDAARARHTELIIELNPALKIGVDEISEFLPRVWSLDYEDFDDFVEKYGEPIGQLSTTATQKAFYVITEYFNGLGFLLHRGLIDIDEIEYLLSGSISEIWGRVRPVIEGMRTRYSMPNLSEWFEYLHERMLQREQALLARP